MTAQRARRARAREDRGLRRGATSARRRPRRERIKGKLGYLAPEQGEGGPLDARTDLFAVGVVLWELVAGRALFAGPNAAAVMQAVLRASPPPLVEVRRELEGATPRARRSRARRRRARSPRGRPRRAGPRRRRVLPDGAALRGRARARDPARLGGAPRRRGGRDLRGGRRRRAPRGSVRCHRGRGRAGRRARGDGEPRARTTAPRGRRSRSPAVVALGAGSSAGWPWRSPSSPRTSRGVRRARSLRQRPGPDAARSRARGGRRRPGRGGAPPRRASRRRRTRAPRRCRRARTPPRRPRVARRRAPRARARTSAGHGAATARPSSTAAGCDPPYRVDARGVKIFRPECL